MERLRGTDVGADEEIAAILQAQDAAGGVVTIMFCALRVALAWRSVTHSHHPMGL